MFNTLLIIYEMNLTTYFFKYVPYIIIVILFGIYYNYIKQSNIIFSQVFIEQNPDLSYPLKTGEVTSTVLWLFAFFVPLTIIIVSSIYVLLISNIKTSTKYFMWLLIGLVICLLANSAFTETFKILFGEPRPSFFAICNYQNYTYALESNNFTKYNSLTTFGKFGDIKNCFASQDDIKDAFASFPSGHASLMFAGMTFATLILLNLKFKNEFIVSFAHAIIPLGLYILATWVCITRVQDYKHRTYDVLGGAIFGTMIAYGTWNSIKLNVDRLDKDPLEFTINI